MVRCLALTALLSGLVFATAPVEAHRVHAGASEVTLNERTGELEIIHRLFVVDVMDVMGWDQLDPAEALEQDGAIEALGAYVGSLYRMGDHEGRLMQLDYVGAEFEGEFAWIYFTASPPPESADSFIVDNDILVDLLDDQVNLTNVRWNGRIRTALQGPGRRDAQRLRFD